MPALSGLIGLTLYHPFVPVVVRHTKGRRAGTVRSAPVRARDRRRTWALRSDTTRRLGSDDGQRLERVARVGRAPFWVDSGRPDPVR